ncbi:hypothetical protein QBC38DRAFT_536537 [Podospora fimiseda]|uniref:Methyltransferase domain-containing protein n=1 Tax=Podospora fimiseda TaxID=252190 RepID=A0AAN7BQ02_9PEZI|nr:hypothetical protein QBC38DRAFT_536537 [Podospora fimiseda]
MADSQTIDSNQILTSPHRLNEQHHTTTKILGFLIHPKILHHLPTNHPFKMADIACGTGIFLLDLSTSHLLPPETQYIGYDISPSIFPSNPPSNITFKTHDMFLPFPESELNIRFVSNSTPLNEWISTVQNLVSLLKPGACQEIYSALEPFRVAKENPVIGLMIREGNTRIDREKLWREKVKGLVHVHEDVFSTDRLCETEIREKGTRNIIKCFLGCLRVLIGEDEGWTEERVKRLEEEAMREIDEGVYHTPDQVCIVGMKGL